VLAINRHGRTLREKLGEIKLQMGDVLLVQGLEERIQALKKERDLTLLGELRPSLYRRRKGGRILAFFLGAVVVGEDVRRVAAVKARRAVRVGSGEVNTGQA
jgi:di/tricarboxylate transporter